MVFKIADNIISPLGFTSEQNYRAVKSGKSALAPHNLKGLQEKVYASLFSDGERDSLQVEGLSRFESLVYRSARQALDQIAGQFDLTGKDVVFVLGTTKGNIENLGKDTEDDAVLPGESARRICSRLGITTTPIVVCNACISGLNSIILASKLLESGAFKYAVVCGADVLGKFIISGFQALKTLSEEACRPFDIERCGMNLGEAAATMVLSVVPADGKSWSIDAGAVRNDAHNITAPSPKGDGAGLAISEVLEGFDTQRLALVNAHGTSSLFMDQMESVALERAGLADVPANSLKGYFGHTLGAAGILETIVTMKALEEDIILGTKGFEELGVSSTIRISPDSVPAGGKKSFVKTVSGFGGANASILASYDPDKTDKKSSTTDFIQTHSVRITPSEVIVDGTALPHSESISGKELLSFLYKEKVGGYPQFYKMDLMTRLGFIASELLLEAEGRERFAGTDSRAVILFNRSSSLTTDRKYLETISEDNYFPSPSLFVYTLPNIITGEIAIRNKYNGETSFHILPEKDMDMIKKVLKAALGDRKTQSVISGWIDCYGETRFEAELFIAEKKKNDYEREN
ncbi:MAG: 3-oxoacyl-ACP synthase [Bacteroidales bacterium]|nr:3-oxoacyl-ACP synthase [Bacteroidales bacterium]